MFRQLWVSKLKLDDWVKTREGLSFRCASLNILLGVLFFVFGVLVREDLTVGMGSQIHGNLAIGNLLWFVSAMCIIIGLEDIVRGKCFRKEDSEEDSPDA